MADRFPLIANPSTSTIQEIPSGDTLDLTGNNINGAGIITATTFSGNLTGSVTGNAGGLTGTPNVVVGTVGCGNVTSTGDVTGVNATFSGNLTVNGTTTTIDTAVTAVDSLAVDGQITAGSIGIGTTIPRNISNFGSFAINGTSGAFADYVLNGTRTGTVAVDSNGFSCEAVGASTPFRVITNGLERLRTTSGGFLKVNSTDGGSYHTIRLNTTTNNAIKDVLHVHSSVDSATAAAGYGVRLNFSGEQSNGNEYTFGGIAGLLSSAGANYGDLAFYTNNNGTNSEKLRITSAGDLTSTGTISDSIGPLRRLGINNHNAATYTLVAGDAGKLVREATSAANITIPQNVFSAGDMISIFNVSTGDNTITQGSGATLYNTADGATGNRTLAAKGVCTIVCTSTNEFIISGSGLS